MKTTKGILKGFALITTLFSVVSFSQSETGIELYNEGKFEAAISNLKSVTKKQPDNVEAWYYLGLSYFEARKIKQAGKVFEKLVKLRPADSQAHAGLGFVHLFRNKLGDARREALKAKELNKENLDAHYILGVVAFREGDDSDAYNFANEAIRINNRFANAYLLKCDALKLNFARLGRDGIKRKADRHTLLHEATEALEQFVALSHPSKEREFRIDELNSLKFFSDYYSKKENQPKDDDGSPQAVDPTITPLRILSKQWPLYTADAREANVQGIVLLAVGFQLDGKIKHVLVLKGLSHGLTEQAVIAAREIKFQPQMKDGKPVSGVRKLEYSFTLF